ncbi:MAG: hypothetical protein HY395_00810, partial [Candidatus Doudnabacteria bacterium]|nr:hypothetical protein [Candidatus Doudnabacteria bacterium]
MPDPSDIEAQLAEEQRRQELEQLAQQERVQKQSAAGEMAKQIAKQAVKKVVKSAAKKAATRYGLTATLAAISAPAWGTILLVLGIALFLIIILTASCNSTSGWLLNLGARIFTFGQVDICGSLTVKTPNIAGAPDPRSGICKKSYPIAASTGCPDLSSCVDVSSYTSARGCESNAGVCLLSPSAAFRAKTLIDNYNADVGGQCQLVISSTVQVTQQISASRCHSPGESNTGTCADFNIVPPSNLCLDYFYSAAANSGAVVSFQDEYSQSCIAETTTGGNIHVN